jgi:hypothetical protein
MKTTLQSRRTFTATLTGIVCLAMTTTTFAATITNLGSANPTGVVEQHFDGRQSQIERINGGNSSVAGQTFTAPNDFVWNSVALEIGAFGIENIGSTSNDLQIKVFNMNGNPDAGLPDSDNVLLQTITYTNLNSLTPSGGDWLNFEFDSPIAATSGDLYGFMVYWGSEDPQNRIGFQGDLNGDAPAGDKLSGGLWRRRHDSYTAANWTGANPWSGVQTDIDQNAGGEQQGDLSFVIFAAEASVPEPSTFALLALGLGFAALRRRRNRRPRS